MGEKSCGVLQVTPHYSNIHGMNNNNTKQHQQQQNEGGNAYNFQEIAQIFNRQILPKSDTNINNDTKPIMRYPYRTVEECQIRWMELSSKQQRTKQSKIYKQNESKLLYNHQ